MASSPEAADFTLALAWLPADGSWRAEPLNEPELSRTVDMLSDFANRMGGCQPVEMPGRGTAGGSWWQMMREPTTSQEAPKIIAQAGAAGGPTYAYRGAKIGSNEKGAVFSFRLGGFLKGGWSGLGNIDLIVRVVDSWLDTGKLPPPYVTPR